MSRALYLDTLQILDKAAGCLAKPREFRRGHIRLVVKIAGSHAETISELREFGRRQAVASVFVFLDLLETDADLPPKLLLRKPASCAQPYRCLVRINFAFGGDIVMLS
jgi:hypothetical protein